MTATPQPPRVTVEHKCDMCGQWMPVAHGKRCFACVAKRRREQEAHTRGQVCARPGCGKEVRPGSTYCCSLCNVRHFNEKNGYGYSEETVREAAAAESYWKFVGNIFGIDEARDPAPAVDGRIAKLMAVANDPAATPQEQATARRLAEKLTRKAQGGCDGR